TPPSARGRDEEARGSHASRATKLASSSSPSRSRLASSSSATSSASEALTRATRRRGPISLPPAVGAAGAAELAAHGALHVREGRAGARPRHGHLP
ncbi:unnamed protein product, partial [Prorocentrum cordatum]